MAVEIDSLSIPVQASSEQAERQIRALIQTINNLSSTLNTASLNAGKYATAMNSLGSSSRKVEATSKATASLSSNFRGLFDITTKQTSKFNKLAYSFGKFYASMFLAIRGVKSLKNAMVSSMDYVETFNYFNVATDALADKFQNQYAKYGYDSAEAYAESFQNRLKELSAKMTGFGLGKNGELLSTGQKNLGLDPNQLMNYQARLTSITTSVGMLGEASVNTTKALSMLSADLSSLTNTDLETVMTNLSSGLVGQSRALYKYGIDITSASLAQVALEHDITKSVSAMTQQEKMQLRVLAILEQSKVAWGDQANTISSVSLVAA